MGEMFVYLHWKAIRGGVFGMDVCVCVGWEGEMDLGEGETDPSGSWENRLWKLISKFPPVRSWASDDSISFSCTSPFGSLSNAAHTHTHTSRQRHWRPDGPRERVSTSRASKTNIRWIGRAKKQCGARFWGQRNWGLHFKSLLPSYFLCSLSFCVRHLISIPFLDFRGLSLTGAQWYQHKGWTLSLEMEQKA